MSKEPTKGEIISQKRKFEVLRTHRKIEDSGVAPMEGVHRLCQILPDNILEEITKREKELLFKKKT